ncbi:Tripartite ATP-independent transporter, DctQ component [Palleronia salina]|uniref:TRAP transporter small permease protein n=1 Tax=Palleronia salina TaxID=313368 RepID=A0A1M6GUF2_9RHOB|nr:TRAP transporter small permease [Palleronia salina]SHJ13618.1 Tripartite ATP-independent transporter, DctQ component [Palleronia salina]
MLTRIEKLFLDLAAIAVVGLGALITISVCLRVFANSGIPDTVVMVRELMVAAIVLPLAAVVTARANIVVEVLTQHFPRRAQDWLVVFGSIVGLFALLPLMWAGWHELAGNWSSGSFFFGQLSLPKWPGRALFFLGVAVCWVRLAITVWRDIATIRAGGHIDGGPAHVEDEA